MSGKQDFSGKNLSNDNTQILFVWQDISVWTDYSVDVSGENFMSGRHVHECSPSIYIKIKVNGQITF